jgi:short-subunit dehydrogenase
MPDVVMVTGASAGAGRSMAKRFAAAGFDIVAVARREELLAVLVTEIESEYGVRVTPVCADLTLPRAAERVYDEVRPLGVSVLVNNAGIGDWNYAWDVGIERLHEMIDLNVRALSVLSVLFVRDNKDRDAQLINVASGAGYALFVGAAPYSATKFFVTALTEGIHHDLRATGATLRAKLLVPGPIDTEFTAVSLAETKLPIRRKSDVEFHTADDIADFAFELFESNCTVGMVDTADRSFHLGDHVHPTAQLTRARSDTP